MTNATASSQQVTSSLARLDDLEIRLYRLETKSHLRIGAGEGSVDISAAENPLIRALVYEERTRDGVKEVLEKRVPYVPGSSLHGVIRAWTEKVLRSQSQPLTADEMASKLATGFDNLKNQARQEVGDLLGKTLPEGDDSELFKHWQVYPNVCDPLMRVDQCERISPDETAGWKGEKARWWAVIPRPMPCEVCRIYGYTGQRGRVKVSHAFPTSEQLPVDIITRVAINRITGAADEGKLFDLEAIPPGAVFYFFVVMENMSPDQKAAFEKGVRALNLQLAGLGAHSTIGFGMVQVAKVYAARLERSIFDVNVERDMVPRLLQAPYRLRVDLDCSKYPDFLLALSSVDQRGQPPRDVFGDHVRYL